MNHPSIFFRYSSVYDNKWKNHPKYGGDEYPNRQTVEKALNELEALWNNYGETILASITTSTGLSWKHERMTCYVIGRGASFSDPLTIAYNHHNDSEKLLHILTHELIHQLFIQNETAADAGFEPLLEKYPEEMRPTYSHIPVHAAHAAALLDAFDEETLKRQIETEEQPGYRRSWEIVRKEGHAKILEEFRKAIKQASSRG